MARAALAAELDQFEADCEQRLKEFLEDASRATYEFPTTLSNLQRKVVHRVAERLQLSHTSVGQDADRHIVCGKASPSAPPPAPPAPRLASGLSLRQRAHFLKDFSLPLPTIHSPYFEFFLDWYQPLLGTRDLVAGVLEDIAAFGGEDAFVEHLQAKKRALVDAIKGTDAFRRFPEEARERFAATDALTRSVPARNTWLATEAGQYFISLDLSSANFFALRYNHPDLVLGADTYEALVQQFTPCFWLRKSKMLRQIICSELHQPGQNLVISHVIRSLADLLHLHCSVPLEQFHGVNHDEVLLRTTAATWQADAARYTATLLAHADPAVARALKLEAYTVRQLAPKPYFVKEVLWECRLAAGEAAGEADGTVQRVYFKCVPPAHFAQAFDHYPSLAARCVYAVDRTAPLYPKCLYVTECAKHLATAPDPIFGTAPRREPPPVSCLNRCLFTEKTRRRIVEEHRLPISATASPYFEHLVDFYDPYFGARAILQRCTDALPCAAAWRRAQVGSSVPDPPATEALLPAWHALCEFVRDDSATHLSLAAPAEKALKSPFFSLLQKFGVMHVSQAGAVVCAKELPALSDATAGQWEDTARDWVAACLGLVTAAVRATAAFAALEALSPEALADTPLAGHTPRAAEARLPAGLRPWSGFAQQAAGYFLQVRLADAPFHALRAYAPEAVLQAASLPELVRHCCGAAAHPYLWRSPQLCDRLWAGLAPKPLALGVQHLCRLVAMALLTNDVAEPSELALDGGLPGVVLRCDSWTSPEDVHTAAQAARRAVAEWFAAHGEPPEVVAEVFRVTRKDNCWLADRLDDGPGERRLLCGNVAPELLPQYLRWHHGEPLQDVDRLAWPEGGADKWLLMEPVPGLWP